MASHPDSLKPMCPIRPMPSSCRSMPPAALMVASYSSHNLRQHSLKKHTHSHRAYNRRE